MSDDSVKILLIEDSLTARRFLKALLEQGGKNVVIAQSSGQEGLACLASNSIDVIVTDIIMPQMDGYAFLKEAKKLYPHIPAIIVSCLYKKNDPKKEKEALDAGAFAIFEKPLGLVNQEKEKADELLSAILSAVGKKVLTQNKEKISIPQKVKLVVFGASMGGPAVLGEILSKLKSPFSVPVVIVQHLGEDFGLPLTDWFNTKSTIPVEPIPFGSKLENGRVYLAVGGANISYTDQETIVETHDATQKGSTPSIDIFYSSLARSLGSHVAAFLLTGMGNDGAKGMLELKSKGAYTVAQHPDGCPMYGMPKVAVEMGAQKDTLKVDEIVACLNAIGSR
ncbi:MAG: Protein-glutamate methylesterase/protein-glutamine glutaminase [Chlamydiia bacterium]|nr:Protein-glutamate methylesterase/protein-glutamine glutaminase [Chlamydiia bacterium]